jgi:hypothetical protein
MNRAGLAFPLVIARTLRYELPPFLAYSSSIVIRKISARASSHAFVERDIILVRA